jgi:dTDP-4-amino-4,6-dideoxygalactose transaminase
MILFNDFKKQYSSIQTELDEAIKRVLESGWYVLGTEVESFEKEFAGYLGANYCIGVASGTEAIALALIAMDIGEGHEVIVPCLTAFPTITGIIQSGATPVLVDVSEYDGLIDINKIEQKITGKTRAIIPVHLYGQSCEMEQLHHVASTHNLLVIEDCAQSAGTKYKHEFTGTYGISGAFSFYPTKNLGAVGDGGAIVTNEKDVYEKCLQLRNYGQSKRYYHDSKGINSRLDELQAAILKVKLKYLEKWNERRRMIALEYRKKLTTVECIRENTYGTPNYHLFVVKCRERDRLIEYLKEKEIQTLIHYPVPINKQNAFYWQKAENFPATEHLADHVLSLPIYPELTNEEVEYIISAVNGFR